MVSKRETKLNKDDASITSRTSTTSRRLFPNLRIFGRMKRRNSKKENTTINVNTTNDDAHQNGTHNNIKSSGVKSNHKNNTDFHLDAVGFESAPTSAETVHRLERQYNSHKNNNTNDHHNRDRDRHHNHHQGGGGSGLIPLMPIQEALSIDDAPIGRAADVASVAGSILTSPSTGGKGLKNSRSGSSKKPKVSIVAYCMYYLCHTKYFQNLCNNVFDIIDQDQSGYIDQYELYQGTLLIHLQLGCYAGPAACKPISKERCQNIFISMDHDQSGVLDRNEFHNVMILLFGNVFIRVIVQWYLTIIFVPISSKYILSQSMIWYHTIINNIIHSQQYETLQHSIALTSFHEDIIQIQETYIHIYYYQLCQFIQHALIQYIPDVVLANVLKMYEIIRDIINGLPDDIWYYTIPLTLISSILGLIVVPYCIFKVDDFFTWLGDLLKGHPKNTNTSSSTNNSKQRQGPPIVVSRSSKK